MAALIEKNSRSSKQCARWVTRLLPFAAMFAMVPPSGSQAGKFDLPKEPFYRDEAVPVVAESIEPSGTQAGVVYVTTANGPLFKSVDGGRTFRDITPAIPGWVFSSVRCAPSEPNVIYANTRSGLFRSNDGGTNWSAVAGPSLQVLSVDPRASDHVLGLTFKAERLQVAESYDGGESQTLLDSPVVLTCDTEFSSAWIVPGTKGTFVFSLNRVACLPGVKGTGFGLLTQGRGNWKPMPSKDADSWPGALEMSRWPSVRIFSGKQRWASQNGGGSWTRDEMHLPGGAEGLSAVTADAKTSRVLYGFFDDGRSRSFKPTMRSDDEGLSWRHLGGVPNSPIAIAADRVEPGWVYVSTWNGFYTSHDGGKTWGVAEGLFGNEVYSVAVHPVDPKVAYAGNARGEIFSTNDGGRTWSHADSDLPRHAVWEIIIDPKNSRRLVVGTDSCAWISNDIGATWKPARCIAPEGHRPGMVPVYSIAPVGREAWAAASERGVLLSFDEGWHWMRLAGEMTTAIGETPYGGGLLFGGLMGLREIREQGNEILLWSDAPAKGRIQTILTDQTKSGFIAYSVGSRTADSVDPDVGVWKADQHGPRFCRSADFEAIALAASPGDPYVLYAGTRGRGLQMSLDRGSSWQPARGLEQGWVYSIAVCRAVPNVIYVASGEGIYVSTDAGLSWTLSLDSKRFPIREYPGLQSSPASALR